MKTIKPYLIVTILVLLAIIMISNKLIFWGIGVLAAALIILGVSRSAKEGLLPDDLDLVQSQ